MHGHMDVKNMRWNLTVKLYISILSFAQNVIHTVLSPVQNSDYIMVRQVNAILSATDYLFDVSVGHSYRVHLIYTNIYKMLHSTEVSVDLPVLP